MMRNNPLYSLNKTNNNKKKTMRNNPLYNKTNNNKTMRNNPLYSINKTNNNKTIRHNTSNNTSNNTRNKPVYANNNTNKKDGIIVRNGSKNIIINCNKKRRISYKRRGKSNIQLVTEAFQKEIELLRMIVKNRR